MSSHRLVTSQSWWSMTLLWSQIRSRSNPAFSSQTSRDIPCTLAMRRRSSMMTMERLSGETLFPYHLFKIQSWTYLSKWCSNKIYANLKSMRWNKTLTSLKMTWMRNCWKFKRMRNCWKFKRSKDDILAGQRTSWTLLSQWTTLTAMFCIIRKKRKRRSKTRRRLVKRQ